MSNFEANTFSSLSLHFPQLAQVNLFYWPIKMAIFLSAFPKSFKIRSNYNILEKGSFQYSFDEKIALNFCIYDVNLFYWPAVYVRKLLPANPSKANTYAAIGLFTGDELRK